MDVTANSADGGQPSGPTAREDFKVIGLIGVAHFFSHFYILLLAPVFPLLKEEFSLDYVELGFLLSIFAAGTMISQVPIGFLVDRVGARSILIIGQAIESLCFVAMGFAGEYWLLVPLYAVAGLANGVYHPADYAILTGSVSKARMGRAFSLHTFTGYAGFAAAPVVISFLAALYGWRTGFIICGIAGLAAAVLLLLFRDTMKYQTDDDEKAAKEKDGSGMKEGMAMLLSGPILMCFTFFLMLALFSSGINNFSVATLNQLFGTELTLANTALTTYLVGTTTGILLGGIIADRTRRHNLVAAVCFFITAIMMTIIASIHLPWYLLVGLMGAQGFLHGMIMPSRDMIVRSVAPEGAVGKVFGFVSTGLSVGSLSAPLMYGYILDNSEPVMVFYIIAGLMILSMFTVFTSGKRSPA